MLGWIAAHHDLSARKVGDRYISNITGDRGSPDLILVRPPQLVFAELKTGKRYGKGAGTGAYGLTPDQKRWGEALRACPSVFYAVWTPDDMDEIARVLAR